MKPSIFHRIGNAYVTELSGSERFWIKRRNGRWDLLWQHRELGKPIWSKLATHATLTDAIEDGEALARWDAGEIIQNLSAETMEGTE